MAEYSQAVAEAVENYFSEENLKFSGFNERGIAKAGFGIKTKFGHADVFFIAQDHNLSVRAMVPLHADEDTRAEVAEFLLRANYGLKNGGFDFDFDDGEISFRLAIYCGKEVDAPTQNQIEFAIYTALSAVQRYGDGLARVIYGMETAQEAIEKIDG